MAKKTGLASLSLFMAIMWLMILSVAAFLAIVVPELDTLLGRQANRLFISIAEAIIAVMTVLLVIIGLNIMKRIYMEKIIRY